MSKQQITALSREERERRMVSARSLLSADVSLVAPSWLFTALRYEATVAALEKELQEARDTLNELHIAWHGISYDELKLRVTRAQAGEGIPHQEVMRTMRDELARLTPDEAPFNPSPSSDRERGNG